MHSERAETKVKTNNCKSKELSLPQPFHDQLRSDLAALEHEHLIESFLDAEHTLRCRIVEHAWNHLKDATGVVRNASTNKRVDVRLSLLRCPHVTDS
jgi:hypothetical protein